MSLCFRKPTRLPGYDYSADNYYFITICTHEKACIFGKPKELNALGEIAKAAFCNIETHFSTVQVDQCIVMPNHVHAIIQICGADSEKSVNLSTVVGLYKSGVTREIRKLHPCMQVWQRSFHDHVIRNQQEYENIWTYVHYNHQKWSEDCFYIPLDE